MELTGEDSAVISASDVPFKSCVADDVHDGVNAQRAEAAACGILIRDEVAADLERVSAQRADSAFDGLIVGERRVACNRHRAADVRAAVRTVRGVADDFKIAADVRGIRGESAVIAARDVAVESRIADNVQVGVNAQRAETAARGILVRDEISADLERVSAQRADSAFDSLVVGDRRVAGNRRRPKNIRAAVRSVRGVADDFEIAADIRSIRVERADISASGVLREADVLLDVKQIADKRGAVATARSIPLESRGTADQERRIDAQSAGISGRDVVVRGQIAADGESRGNLNSADLASGDVALRDEIAFNA